MHIEALTITGQSSVMGWKIMAHYTPSLDMLEIVWAPEEGRAPFRLNGRDTGIPVRIYDESTVVIKHPATILNTVEFTASHHSREPKGIQLSPFSRLPSVGTAATVAKFILLLKNRNGFGALEHVPNALMHKIGFIPMSLLRAMVPAHETA